MVRKDTDLDKLFDGGADDFHFAMLDASHYACRLDWHDWIREGSDLARRRLDRELRHPVRVRVVESEVVKLGPREEHERFFRDWGALGRLEIARNLEAGRLVVD